MERDIERVLVTKEQLEDRVAQLGAAITKDYTGKKLLVLGILKGSVPFMSDLIRQIKMPIIYDFMVVSSYGSAAKSSGIVRIHKDLERSVEDVHILIVEDIVDTGLTLKFLRDNLLQRNPLSIRIVTLLDKPNQRQADVVPDYNGFVIPEEFVVGYGLDYNEHYRNLPYIGVLKREIYES